MKTHGAATATLLFCLVAWPSTGAAQRWEPATTLAPKVESDPSFGRTVACSGDAILVGADRETNVEANAGVAYLFTGASFDEVQRLEPAEPVRNGQNGAYVALQGDTALLGNARLSGGDVRVLVRSGTGWSQQQKLEPTTGGNDGSYGRNVRLSGDTALVGAPKQETDTGAVYVYTRSGDTWGSEVRLTADDAQTGDFFGYTLDLDGDTLVASAPGNAFFRDERGGVYIFERSSSGWTQTQRLSIEGEPVSPPAVYYGADLSLDGDTLAVAATAGADNQGEGRVDVYVREGGSFVHAQTLTAPDIEALGAPLVLRGDHLWVAARVDGVHSVLVYERAAGTWSEVQRIQPDVVTTEGTGVRALAACGGTLVIGMGDTGDWGDVHVWRNPELDAPATVPDAGAGPLDSPDGSPGPDGGATAAPGSPDSGGGCAVGRGARTSSWAWFAVWLAWLLVRRGLWRARAHG